MVMLLVGAVFTFLAFKAVDTLRTAAVPLSAQQSQSAIMPRLPAEVQRWEEPLVRTAQKYDIDADFVAIIMTIESMGNPDAESPVGAQGLMQVMPYTAEDIAAKHLKQPVNEYDLKEPHTNIEFGVAYLAHLRDQFGEAHEDESTVRLVAAGYNGGPGAALQLEKGQLEYQETIKYTEKAVALWRERE